MILLVENGLGMPTCLSARKPASGTDVTIALIVTTQLQVMSITPVQSGTFYITMSTVIITDVNNVITIMNVCVCVCELVSLTKLSTIK